MGGVGSFQMGGDHNSQHPRLRSAFRRVAVPTYLETTLLGKALKGGESRRNLSAAAASSSSTKATRKVVHAPPARGKLPPDSLEGEEEAAGDHNEADREEKDAAVPRQHEAPATIEPVAPGENLPLAAGPRSQSRGGGAGGHGGRGSRSGGGSRGARRDLPILAVFHGGGGGGWPPPSGPPRAPLPERRDGRDRAALPLRRPPARERETEAGPAAAGTRFHPRPPSQRGPPGAAPPRAGREPALQAATPTGPLPPRPSQGRRAPRRMRARARRPDGLAGFSPAALRYLAGAAEIQSELVCREDQRGPPLPDFLALV